MAGITDLRYIRRRNLAHEQNIQKEYFREIVHSYGIDLAYFRKYLDFYHSPSGVANYTYGEDSTASYYLSADMVCYMEMMGDSFLLSKFGIETDGDCAIYFTIDDFNEQFRDTIGVEISTHFSADLYSDINTSTALLTGVVEGDGLSGEVRVNVAPVASGGFIQSVSEPIIIYPNAVNPDVKGPAYYDYGQYDSTGFLTGILTGYTNISGDGFVSGRVEGDVLHTTKPAELRNITWTDISPQVGDFFRIDFEETNQEEYEITRVHDRNLQTDGLNPLLGKYIWRCDCVRRDPSYEDVIGDVQEEALTTSKIEQNTWHEDVSNEIFDYDNTPVDEVDGTNSDAVYGSY
jgi:hypothetical protein